MFRKPDRSATPVPLKPTVYLVLLALAEEERHGYAIVKAIEARTPGLRIEPGNLYRMLKGMLAEGLVEEVSKRPDPHLDDERRRYFRITKRGTLAAQRETERLEGLVRHAKTLRPIAPRRG